jgi:hypothetical protein
MTMLLTQTILEATVRNTVHLAGMHHQWRAASRLFQDELRGQMRQQCPTWGDLLAVARELRGAGELARRKRQVPTFSLAGRLAEEDAGERMVGERYE